MTNIKDLKICIVEYKLDKVGPFVDAFKNYPNVHVYNTDLLEFFDRHMNEIDAIVSPGNSFGIMAGGFDARISDILGWDFQKIVQDYIKKNYPNGQKIGTSIIFDTMFPWIKLIHTPTMHNPGTLIKDNNIITKCMRSTIKCALEHNRKCIVVPIFGGLNGGVPASISSKRMLEGYEQLLKGK